LSIGYAGISAVPQLLPHHNIRKTEQSYSLKAICSRELENSFEWRCDVEGTRYAGLLHLLTGIPDSGNFNVNQKIQPVAARGLAYKAVTDLRTGYVPAEKKNSFSSAFAIIQNMCRLALSPDCTAVKTGQRVYFLRAFTLNYMPHGPPKIAPETFFAS
jgi:hypothetical protein